MVEKKSQYKQYNVKKQTKNNKKKLDSVVRLQKAFDEVPHSWLIETLNVHLKSTILTDEKKLTFEKPDLNLTTETPALKIENIHIKNEIYQEDAFSSLMFCMTLFPIELS